MSIADDWQPLAIETDPDRIIAQGLDDLQAELGPGWTAYESHVEVALTEAFGAVSAGIAAAVRQEVDLVGALGFGVSVMRVIPLAGTRAQLQATFTVAAAGVTIPNGFTVTGTTADGIDVAFLVPTTVTSTSTTLVVQLVARDVGAASNGVLPGVLRVNNVQPGVVQVAATGASTGGSDPESLQSYLTRLQGYVGTLSPGGVRADRLGPLVRSVPGVQRVLAIDLFDPTVPGSDPVTQPAERTVTVYPLAADGGDVDEQTAAAVAATIAAVREVNFVVRIGTPERTAVDVQFAGTAKTGNTPATVRTDCIAAVRRYLDDARWGGTVRSDGSLPVDWTETRIVRYLEVLRALGDVDGLGTLTSLTINGTSADVTLPGPAALPAAASTVDGTVL